MRLLRIVLIVVLLAILAAGLLLWFNVPGKADLAEYAPADALIYVEFNNLADVARAIQNTDVWKAAAPITHSKPPHENRLFTAAARAGLGPIESVLFARTQVALVMISLNTQAENETLKVRPEIALIAETHTTRWRTRPVMIDAVRRLANFAYGASSCSAPEGDSDLFQCSIPGSDRKLVGAIQGTTVILANSDNALRTCLDVRGGSRPSMITNPEFISARASVVTKESLGFGYIPSTNSAKLFSRAIPLWLRVANASDEMQQMFGLSASKILRGIAWTAVPSGGGIEDRFLVSLEPAVVSRLEPIFQAAARDEGFWKLMPGDFHSLTLYRIGDPSTAWSSLNSAVALKVDTVAAVLFGRVLDSSLTSYGVFRPRETLAALSPPLLTLRRVPDAEEVLIAKVSDEARLKRILEEDGYNGKTGQILKGLDATPDPQKQFTAVLVDGYVILGWTENVAPYLAELRKAAASEENKLAQEAIRESTATIVTYTNDETRLTSAVSTLVMLQGRQLSGQELSGLQAQAPRFNFAETETRLYPAGIERKTHSAFGQFSTFMTLLQATNAASAAR